MDAHHLIALPEPGFDGTLDLPQLFSLDPAADPPLQALLQSLNFGECALELEPPEFEGAAPGQWALGRALDQRSAVVDCVVVFKLEQSQAQLVFLQALLQRLAGGDLSQEG
jgi:hypothetical protein